MKIRRKTDTCLNCGSSLDGTYNYCPKCGQENTNSNVSFKTLLGDFFNTYLAIDSRFAKSIKPFLIKPGWLTNKYTEGKRVSYAHPLRLYLIISIFYFFILSHVGQKIILSDDGPIIENNTERAINASDSLALSKIGLTPDSLAKITANNKNVISKEAKDSFKNAKNKKEKIGTENKLDTIQPIQKEGEHNFSIIETDENFILDRIDFDLINKYKNDEKVSNENLYDSLKLENLSFWEELLTRQSIRVVRADEEVLAGFILKNLPLMMLILIPLFALILKLLYLRRKEQLYIKHIIHALHLHSFAYFLYGIGLIVIFLMIENEDQRVLPFIVSFILVTTYAFISFKRVYNQKWWKTTIKFFITGMIYFIFIGLFFAAEMITSFLLF